MRNLTLTRTKCFVGSLAKMKVYIEDPASDEITIQGFTCRKLCDLKNGEKKTVPIGENAARLFVIADALSKDYCNEFYDLPAGQEDISLSGKNHFNPGAGNPFRFDGNTNEDVIQNRKKGSKKGMIILCAAIVIGAVIGSFIGVFGMRAIIAASASAENTSPKTFSAAGMEITLNDQFQAVELEGFTACYDSNIAAVTVLKEPFTLVEGLENYTLKQYGELLLENNGMQDFELCPMDDRYYFEYTYTDEQSSITFYYMSVIYRSQDAFWLIQFSTPEENLEQIHEEMISWANSVTFS